MSQPAISSDLIRGHIDTIILYTLINEDKYAQQISDSIEEKSNGQYKINQATLYSSLKRLESLKYVSSYWNEADGAGRRKYFKLSESGKTTVNDNLASWSYSKGVIDTLMDMPSDNVQSKVVYVEKPVVQTVIVKNDNDKENDFVENKKDNKQELSPQNSAILISEEVKEINYKEILNSLIQKNAAKPKEVIEPLIKEKEDNLGENKQKLNEKIDEKSVSNDKLDDATPSLKELMNKAVAEGYKIRVSSKNTIKPKQGIKINLLALFSALIYFLFCLAEFTPLILLTKSTIQYNTLYLVILSIFALTLPVITLIKYFINPNKVYQKKYTGDMIVTSALIIFNVILVLFAIIFIVDINLSVTGNLVKYLIIPLVLMIDVVIYFIAKFLLSKSKKLHSINKK